MVKYGTRGREVNADCGRAGRPARSFTLISDTNKPMNSTYTTNDFYASAFLVASGVSLFSHFRTNGKTTFEFRQTDELARLIDDYYADHVKISPIRYGNSLKNLKALIYSGNTNTNNNGKTT
jgi:hypothetical protein